MNCIIPESVDRLTPTGFRLTINATRFGYLEYFCVATTLPSVDLSSATTNFRNNKVSFTGDTIEYGSFMVKFIVDEELKNYLELYNWILKNSFEEEEFLDMTLSILTNQNNTNKQIQFLSAAPTGLSELQFDAQNTSLEYVTCDATFSYNTFKFLR